MRTFTEFLEDAAHHGRLVNAMFEERLFGLAGVLARIADALSAAQVPYELIGGLAVLIHVEAVNPEHSALTRDVDLMVWRSDLDRVRAAAAGIGYRFRHAAGVDMLLPDASDSRHYAVHLVFSGEKIRPDYSEPAPPIRPEIQKILGNAVSIIPVPDLVRMKLTSFRLKDQVHIQTLDRVGLITPDMEGQLSPELLARLTHVRQSE